jgi:glycosyltransferase involved in cell wall biosynthesis
MKIVFNTVDRSAPCTQFYTSAFSSMPEITFYDTNIGNYDVALFMTYDYGYIPKIKKRFPNLKLGLIDPRSFRVKEAAKNCDFLIVDSIEMEDYWRQVKKPILRYVEYPDVPYINRSHADKETIKIGYHGNLIHLECISETASIALSNLGKRYDIEFVVMYNGKPPSGNEDWYPKNVKVTHVPWSMNNYVDKLGKCDIGIVPNNMIHNVEELKKSQTNHNFNFSDDDYSLRFKMPSNPGRYVIFGRLGVPVVADFYPSALRYLTDDRGLVAHSVGGWEHSIETLIKNSDLRDKMSNNLQKFIKKEWDYNIQNEKLLRFLKEI